MPGHKNDDPLEAALDELYGVDPADFVETRKRLAADLRAAGEKDAAKSLQAARRPTTAAWALNQLSRTEPVVVESFLERSRELQAAQVGALTGGREAMRDATKGQRQALADATDAAVASLGERATDAFRTQIVSTLHAASADETVGENLRHGRLIRELSGSTGFPDGPNLTLVPDLDQRAEPKPPAAKQQKRAPTSSKPDRAANEKAELAEQRRLERERAALEQTQRRLEEAETAAEAAQEAADAAEAAAAEARARALQLQSDLDAARRDARSADDVAARARREATRLARTATRLRSQG